MESTTNETKAKSLYAYFEMIVDPRKKRGIRYPLPVLLTLIVLAKLCGENKPYGMAAWLKERAEEIQVDLPVKLKRMPHHSTIRRILGLCAEEIERAVGLYMEQRLRETSSQTIILDGKTLRGTITPDEPFGLHLLSVYLPEAGITLRQVPVDKRKENEIVMAPKALEGVDLRGSIVPADTCIPKEHYLPKLSSGEVTISGS